MSYHVYRRLLAVPSTLQEVGGQGALSSERAIELADTRHDGDRQYGNDRTYYTVSYHGEEIHSTMGRG